MSPTLPEVASAVIGFASGLAVCAAQLLSQRVRLRAARRRNQGLRRRLDAARHDAGHDPLTGLPNRRALWAQLSAALQTADPRVAVAVVDVDKFKPINDAIDHDFGDQVLVGVAVSLAALPRPVVLAARLGGDEFALVIDGTAQDAAHAARLTRDAIARTVRPPGHQPIDLTATVGYAVAIGGETARSLVRRADLANRHAKRHQLGIHP